MPRRKIVAHRPALLHAMSQEAGMLAAAVVVALVVLPGRRRGRDTELGKYRHMAAALQGLVAQPRLVQHALHLLHMHGFAAVAGAHERKVFPGESHGLGTTRLHERQRLQRLERGAREGDPVRIAGMRQHLALRVGHGHGAEMHGLQGAAAQQFDHGHERAHARIIDWRHVAGLTETPLALVPQWAPWSNSVPPFKPRSCNGRSRPAIPSRRVTWSSSSRP